MKQGIFSQSWLPQGFGANVPEATAVRTVTRASAQSNVVSANVVALATECAAAIWNLMRGALAGHLDSSFVAEYGQHPWSPAVLSLALGGEAVRHYWEPRAVHVFCKVVARCPTGAPPSWTRTLPCL